MGHFQHSPHRASPTPKEWLKVGSQIGDFVNTLANRTDIIAFLGEGAGGGAPACFNPAIAEIEVNRDTVLGEHYKAEWFGDINQRATQFAQPVVTGVVTHESAHARWSRWDLTQVAALGRKEPRLAEIITAMEESRIERFATAQWPKNVPFLRACALQIVMREMKIEEAKEGGRFALSHMMLLTVARMDAGVLEFEDVETLHDAFVEVFTQETYDQFRALWMQAQSVYDHDNAATQLEPIAREWMKLLPEDEQDGGSGGGSGLEGLPQAVKDMLGELGDAVADAAESSEINGREAAAEQAGFERWEDAVKRMKASTKERQQNEQVASEVFSRGTEDLTNVATNSRITERRDPKPKEKAAAIVIGRALEKAKYRDRDATQIHSAMPPGKLSTRDAVQGIASRRAGGAATATPWERTVRKQTDEPTLTVGVAVDISGSMRPAMLPMAVTAYVLAEAGFRVDAHTAQVYFGNDVFATLKPGQRMPQVVVRNAADGTEKFDKAFKALDGQLNLLNGSGARLLVICSDTYWTPNEAVALKKWTERCIQQGVGVLIMPFDDGDTVSQHKLNKLVEVLPATGDPAGAALQIGAAAVKALESIGNRR